MGKTVKDLVETIQGREDYEIIEGISGYFYYEGTYDFNIDWQNKYHTFGKDVLENIEKQNIPIETDVCIWDDEDYHSYHLTHECFKIDDVNKTISLVCKPFA